MRCISTLRFVVLLLIAANVSHAQVYSPVPLTGFNCDVVADAPTVPLNTSIAMDLQNNVMYTQTMAGFLGLNGGIVDNGTILSGTRTYQLASYSGNCALHVPIGSTLSLTLAAPAQYAKLSVLALSTEFYSNVNITAGFTDGTTYNFGSFQVQDWFGGTGSVYSGYGRIFRVAGPPYNLSGYPTDPRMYVVDLTIPCASLAKSLQYLSFNTTSGGGSNCSAFIWALSAVPFTRTIVPLITNVSCPNGSNGSVALNVTGSNAPYTYSWNTVPIQTAATAVGLPAGTYICTITDANGCTVKDTSTVTQPPPIVITPTSSTDSICSGDSVQLSVAGLTALNWAPVGLTTASITVQPVLTTTYTVSGTDANGCTNSGSVIIVVNPGASVTITPNPAAICSGDTVQLQAAGATNYAWSPSVGLSSSTVSNPQAHPNITTIYTVTGTNVGGCSSVVTDTVTVYATTTVSPSATPATLCAGDSSVLAATGLVTYTWNPGGFTTATITVHPITTTTYTATGNDANGCPAQGSVTVQVNQHPAVNIAPAVAAICDGDSVLLAATGATNYTWLPVSGLTNTTTATTYCHPVSTTIYTAIGTDVNGCTGAISITVTVHVLPVVTATANPATICAGNATLLTTTGLTNFTWAPGGLTTSTINVSPASSSTYTVTGTDANGCTGSATTLVTVDVPPTVNASSATTFICEGNSAALTANGTATNYAWSPGGLNGSTISVTPAVTTTYTVTGTTAGNCTTTDTVTINVILLPQAAFAPASATGCDPFTMSFTNQSLNATAWHWMFSDGDSSFLQNPQHTFVSGTWDVTLIAVNSLGCSDTLIQPALVKVYPYPQAAFVPSVVNGCETLTVSFTDQSLINATAWQWLFSNGGSSNAQNPVVTLPSGIYDVTLIATNAIGCNDTLVQSALITVYPKPVAAFTVSPAFNTPVELNEATFTFSDHSTGAINYLWNFGDTATSMLANPIYIYPATGNYNVTLIVESANGCLDTITNGEIIIFQNNFVVIPSAFTPNDDGMNDVFNVPYNPNIKYRKLVIYNRWGQLVFSSQDINKGWDGTSEGMNAPDGVYVYKASIVFDNGQKLEKTSHVTLIR